MEKVGIATVHTGYNYGSMLQAYATKRILYKLRYQGIVISLRGSLIEGRDVRLKKILVIIFRMLKQPLNIKRFIKQYSNHMSYELSSGSKALFEAFSQEFIKPKYLGWRKLKCLAKREEFAAFLCGSDQIWNADALYVDPFYYLRFAPWKKRIAFAPSFGRDKIPQYNKKVMKKYISEIKELSVREKAGVNIIKNLSGREATWILDPTLLVSSSEWNRYLGIKSIGRKTEYILAYFLDKPSERAQECLKKLSQEEKLQVIELPYAGKEDWYDNSPDAGPKEFIYYLSHARYVCTDSFHGTAFSINFEVPFFTFARQYGAVGDQSSRIHSLLELTNLVHRFNPNDTTLYEKIDFGYSRKILERERNKAENYLWNALEK